MADLFRPSPYPGWGVYEDIWSPSAYPKKLEHCMQKLGYHPDYVLVFRDLRYPFPHEVLSRFPDIRFIVSLELQEWRSRGKQGLQDIVAGKYDGYFKQWAREAASQPHPYFLRFGFEMNGGWFSWGKQPDMFIRAWIHVHDIFKREGATQVKWIFSPNILYGSMTPEKDLIPYFPGDAYVDWVGLDGYNFGDNHDKHHKWISYDSLFNPSILAMTKFGKPLMITEVGCADDARKPEWLRHFLESVTADARIFAFVYFNYDKRSEGEPNWALDSDSASFRVFQNGLRRKVRSR